jgi:hypothetical protein
MNAAVSASMLKMAVKLLERWKKVEGDEASDEDHFQAEWAELSEDVGAFLETYNEVRG